jgi:F-type H+-transporting ATPase subunit delta
MNSSEQKLQVRHQTVMDDETRQVARVYAEALYKAAAAANQTEEVLGELDDLVGGVFRRDPGLEVFFRSASISRDRKGAVLNKAVGGRASEVFVRFLGVLNHHERLGMIRPIATAYRNLYNRRARRIVVVARSAVPLTDDERRRLCEDVREVGQIEPLLEERVEPELLGGLVVHIGDWVYDASVRTRLDEIRNQLIERSSHGIESGRDRFSHQ